MDNVIWWDGYKINMSRVGNSPRISLTFETQKPAVSQLFLAHNEVIFNSDLNARVMDFTVE